MAAAQKKERLTMYSLEDRLKKHGFTFINTSQVTDHALHGTVVVCIFPDEKRLLDWLSRYWHNINKDRKTKEQIDMFSKSGITFSSGGRVYPRVMAQDYNFYGYNTEKSVIAMFKSGA
jgi:hypothetical protein